MGAAILTAFFGVLLFRIIKSKKTTVVIEWLMALGLPLISTVGIHLAALSGLYLLALFRDSLVFSSYKGIPDSLVTSRGVAHIVLLALAALCFCECLFMTALYIMLSQDRHMTIWCLHPWKQKFLALVVKLLVVAAFVFDGVDEYVEYTGTALAIILAVKVVHRFCTPMSHTPVQELADLFFDVCLFFLDCIVLLCKGFAVAEMKDYYQFVAAAPIHSAVVCIIRICMRSKVKGVEVRTEDEALEYLRTLLMLCHDKSEPQE